MGWLSGFLVLLTYSLTESKRKSKYNTLFRTQEKENILFRTLGIHILKR